MKNNKIINPLIVIGFLLLLATGCKKDQVDYASQITGTYNGTVTIVGTGTVSGSSTLNKSSEEVVNLIITINSKDTPLNGISVSSAGNNVYNLSYTDASGTFSGQVNGNSLTWTLSAGSAIDTFTGTK